MILNRATRIRMGAGFTPTPVPGWGMDRHIPRMIPTMVPREGVQRTVSFATLVRNAPETANQAVDGLGVLSDDAAPSIWNTIVQGATSLITQNKAVKDAQSAAKAVKAQAAAQQKQAQAIAAAAAASQGKKKSNVMTYSLIAGGIAGVGLLIYMLKKR